MDLIIAIVIIIVLIPVSAWLGWYFNSRFGKNSIHAATEKAEQIIQDAKKKNLQILKEKNFLK